MKCIQYVLTHPDTGDIRSFLIYVPQNDSEETRLFLYRPENLAGAAQTLFDRLIKDGYHLSNWHASNCWKGRAGFGEKGVKRIR